MSTSCVVFETTTDTKLRTATVKVILILYSTQATNVNDEYNKLNSNSKCIQKEPKLQIKDKLTPVNKRTLKHQNYTDVGSICNGYFLVHNQ